MVHTRSRLPLTLLVAVTLLIGVWLGTAVAKKKTAQRPPLTKEAMSTFLNGKRNAVMATIKKDGSPQLTPVWYRWDGEQFWISITKDRAKYKNLTRDARVSLCIDDAETGTTVIASGKARLTEENLWADTQKIAERYRGAEEGPVYIKRMQENKEPRVLVVLKPEKIISWGR